MNKRSFILYVHQVTSKKGLSFLLVLGVVLLGLFSCQIEQQKPLFKKISSTQSGINFKNEIIENDTHNILNFMNLYTGSGVGIGDFNKDGLPDIFFGGNMESSRLYLNKGQLQFEDITQSANVETDRWITGVTVIDINSDGWDDIYLSVSGNATEEQRRNLLFVNQKDNTFKEEAAKYGIDNAAQCTHANFFDYDKDGDLDLFLIINPTDYKLFNVNNIRKRKRNGEAKSTDILYQNNGNGTFSDVSRQAGILEEGYSLGMNVSDLNNDGWADIYITNDFLTNDVIYINNQDGTFTNQAAQMLKHTSFASMGIDVADIDNDAKPDIFVLDMYPEDNYRKKMIMPGGNYERFRYMLQYDYEPQYSRNTLQWNNGDGTFSEIGQLANIHKTDWSWSALLADYDNDGLRDLFITNGFHRDLGDLDYINYKNQSAFGSPETRRQAHLERILNQPSARLANYIYKNQNGLEFTKKTKDWGMDELTCSHGAAYADLDKDGDLDIIVNNVSQEAMIYENQSNVLSENHFLKIEIQPTKQNPHTFGTKVWLYYDEQVQFAELNPYRGYESSVEKILHFGLGKTDKIDRIEVQWNNGKRSQLENIKVDTLLVLDDSISELKPKSLLNSEELFFKKSKLEGLDFVHQEDFQIDFNEQFLLPHQHSLQGPCMAVADVNGDQLEDIFIGGAAGAKSVLFLQQKDASFQKTAFQKDTKYEDVAAVFFDFDKDGDQDLYLASGGVVASKDKQIYQDRLYQNDGKGNFTKTENVLPKMPTSTGCVQPCDIDQDGDIDLFVGGRLVPHQYPQTPQSYLLINENGKFINKTPSKLSNIGMVSTAIWSDIDSDGDKDLLLAGEFMSITIIENINGVLENSPHFSPQASGWWRSLAQGDFDKDGDPDLLVGNLGLNTDYKASPAEPMRLYNNDFDKNGETDPILTQYTDGVEYPIVSRDQILKQIPPVKVRFNSYKAYANATFADLFKNPEKKGMQVLEVQQLQSCYIENKGNFQFEIKPLPLEMQTAPIQDFEITDLNDDGHLDAIAIGNDYSTEVVIGRYDAFTGAVLLGDGEGNFDFQKGTKIGLKADKDAREIIAIQIKNTTNYIIGNNSDTLQVFEKERTLHPDLTIND